MLPLHEIQRFDIPQVGILLIDPTPLIRFTPVSDAVSSLIVQITKGPDQQPHVQQFPCKLGTETQIYPPKGRVAYLFIRDPDLPSMASTTVKFSEDKKINI